MLTTKITILSHLSLVFIKSTERSPQTVSDFTTLTKPQSYFRVPAKSRNQDFVAYRITDNINNEFEAFQSTFKYQYYALDERQLSGNYPKDIIIVIPFRQELTSDQMDTFDLEEIDNNFKPMLYGEAFRYRGTNQSAAFTHYNAKQSIIDPHDCIIDDQPRLDINKILPAIKKYIKTTAFNSILHDDAEYRKFLCSLANDSYNQTYNDKDLKAILKVLQKADPKIKDHYKAAAHTIQTSSVMRSKIGHFGKYIPLYQTASQSNITTLADQLRSMMTADFKPSEDMKLPQAGNLIASVYQPTLIRADGDDRDNIVIFNPLTGAWIHDENDFMALLNALRPYSKRIDLYTMMDNFASQARNQNNFIEPYSGSRYILFKNCMLDAKTMETYSLKDDLVKAQHFTERTRNHIPYNPDVTEPPIIDGERRADGGAWDPKSFFMAYADNDEEKYQFFMALLAFGLFPGHNFGVHINIRGESRWGKSTLATIFQAMYPNQVMDLIFSKLNDQFGLTNYQTNTSIVWVRECNTESDPLNNDYGTPVYDSFGDSAGAHIQVKGHRDLVIKNPPQMFVDGTSFIKAKDMDTGPAGRTLPFKLPMEGDSQNSIKSLTDQAYAIHITSLLTNETILQWLINEMLKAYRTCFKLPGKLQNRLWDLTLTLNGTTGGDNKILPEFARKWRKEMLQTQGDLAEWFTYEFIPYVSKDPANPTKMHNSLAYRLYTTSYQSRYAMQDKDSRFMLNQKAFDRQFDHLLEQNNWQKTDQTDHRGNKTRKSVKYLSKTNFDIDQFQADGNQIPYEFTKENIDKPNGKKLSSFPLAQRTSGWYQLKYEQITNN